jgi:plastocyanin
VRRGAVPLLLVLLVAALAGCGGPATLPKGSDGTGYEVKLSGFAFQPTDGSIPVGAKVTFLDVDGVHDVNDADDAKWGSNFPVSQGGLGREMQPGESWSHVFAAAGTYHLVCHQHHEQHMLMTLVVG